ncbi:hypothetical protein C9426_01440 [Serratia sp. S1B]|nr:hypothetical protein C9426_01440 [Serratia sp. S1B]
MILLSVISIHAFKISKLKCVKIWLTDQYKWRILAKTYCLPHRKAKLSQQMLFKTAAFKSI